MLFKGDVLLYTPEKEKLCNVCELLFSIFVLLVLFEDFDMICLPLNRGKPKNKQTTPNATDRKMVSDAMIGGNRNNSGDDENQSHTFRRCKCLGYGLFCVCMA